MAFQLVRGEQMRLMRAVVIGYAVADKGLLHQTGLNLHRRLVLEVLAPRQPALGNWPWNNNNTASPARRQGPAYPLIAAIHDGWPVPRGHPGG